MYEKTMQQGQPMEVYPATCYGSDAGGFHLLEWGGIGSLRVEATETADYKENATSFKGHSYYIVNQTVTWDEAKTIAKNAGGYLATVTSQEDKGEPQGQGEGCQEHEEGDL